MIDITDRKFKFAFFWSLVLMFFITASFLILYAFGYTFNPERGIFVYAGSITIKSNPRNIDVEMNGINVSKKLNRLNNSFHIGRVHPDEYIIKISAPGFNTWSKKINVRSGFSTEFWNVLLTRTDYERKTYNSSNVSDFFISPSEKLVAATKTENGTFKVLILNTENNSANEIFSSEKYSFAGNKKENIEWAPKSQGLIVPVISENVTDYLLHNFENGSTSSISELSGMVDISNVRWDSNNKNFIYLVSEKNLYRLNIANPSDKRIIAENISGYDISGNYIYYFQLPSAMVFQIKSDGGPSPVQITTTAPPEMDDNSYKLIVYDEKKIVMRNESGTTYVFNKGKNGDYFRKLSDNAKGTQFSNDGKKLLFWDNREIYVYFLADWETQPYRSENEIKQITRYSQQIENVQWNSDYEHVIFSVGNELKIVELDDRDNRNIFDIARFSKNESRVVGNFSENKIYFIDVERDNNGSIIQSINFPEKNGLIGF